jgi:hypothetical protein
LAPNRLVASNATPVPATMLLMKAIIVAAVVRNATSAPDQSRSMWAHVTAR